jgi:hypothetical protein
MYNSSEILMKLLIFSYLCSHCEDPCSEKKRAERNIFITDKRGQKDLAIHFGGSNYECIDKLYSYT